MNCESNFHAYRRNDSGRCSEAARINAVPTDSAIEEWLHDRELMERRDLAESDAMFLDSTPIPPPPLRAYRGEETPIRVAQHRRIGLFVRLALKVRISWLEWKYEKSIDEENEMMNTYPPEMIGPSFVINGIQHRAALEREIRMLRGRL